jgi:hypothetical protein
VGGIQTALTGGPHWPCGALETYVGMYMPAMYDLIKANSWRLPQ